MMKGKPKAELKPLRASQQSGKDLRNLEESRSMISESDAKTTKSFHSKVSKQSKAESYTKVNKGSKNSEEEFFGLLKAAELDDFDFSGDENFTVKTDSSDEREVQDMIDIENKKKRQDRQKKKIINDNSKYLNIAERDRQMRQIEEQIEKEIREEMKKKETEVEEKFKVEDEERANKILKEDNCVKDAYDKGVVEKWEIIKFIDYYELFSKINRYNLKVSDNLDHIAKECETNLNKQESKHWKDLKKKIEGNMGWKESILDHELLRLRDTSRSVHKGLYNVFDNSVDNLSKSQVDNNQNSMQMSIDSKSSISTSSKQLPGLEKNKPKLKAIDSGLKKLKELKLKNEESDPLQASTSTLSSFKGGKKTLSSIKKCIDLYDGNGIVKMQTKKDERKTILSQTHKSKRQDLFSFNSKQISQDVQKKDLVNDFIDLLNLPNEALEAEKGDWLKKAAIRRKIDDAKMFIKGSHNK